MTRPIRIAAQLHPQHGAYAGMRRAVREAESMGFDLVYNWDHFFPLYGAPDGPHFESWTMLGAWAEQTSTVEFGPLVSCTSYRNADLIADMARTIDHISGGRFVLGLGAGWFRRDYEEYGYEFGTAGARIAGLEEALARITSRWERLNPAPVRRPPILIGGTGEKKTLRLVAEYADGWHAMFPDHPSELEPKVDALLGWCDRVGRDPLEIEWGLGLEPDVAGQLRSLEEHAETYVAMGFTQFTLGYSGPDWDVSTASPWLEWRDRRNADDG